MFKALALAPFFFSLLFWSPTPASAKTIPLHKTKPQALAATNGACPQGTIKASYGGRTYCLGCAKGYSLHRGVGTKDGQRRYFYYCSGCPAGYSKKKINNKTVCWAPDPPAACYGFFAGRWFMEYSDCKNKAGVFKLTAHRDKSGKPYGKMVRLTGQQGCGQLSSATWKCSTSREKDGRIRHQMDWQFKNGGTFFVVGYAGKGVALGRDRIKGLRIKMIRR